MPKRISKVQYKSWLMSKSGLPWWLSGKESACNAGDMIQSLGQEDPLEEGVATESSVLVWESYGQRSLAAAVQEVTRVRHD